MYSYIAIWQTISGPLIKSSPQINHYLYPMLSFKKPITYQPADSYFKISSPHISSKHNTGNNISSKSCSINVRQSKDKLLMPTHNNNKIMEIKHLIITRIRLLSLTTSFFVHGMYWFFIDISQKFHTYFIGVNI